MKLFTSPIVAFTLILFTTSFGWTQSTDRSTLAWTYEQAVQELGYHPADAYLQYVALQLAADSSSVEQLQRLMGGPESQGQTWMQRNAQVDLYSIFSGSLAVQESLQLDAMTGSELDTRDEPLVSVSSLSGPMVDSHPWREMLGDQQPAISELAQCVPDDYLFIRFDSIAKFQQMREFVDAGYIYALGQSAGSVRSAGAMARLQKQWLIETSDTLDPLFEAGVAEVAIASSDLFYGEGTDATLIIRLKEPAAMRAKLEQSLTAQMALHPQATKTSENFLDIPFTHVTTPDRSIHAFVADPTPELHVRSNSRVAFELVIRTILNKPDTGQQIRRLGDSDEFRYVRTLMPVGANEEDGFVYLSDPFIRNLIGAQRKLTQRNRLVCRSRLLVLRHAQLLFMTQHGRRAKSIQELRDGDCLGNSEFAMELICPDGGEYSLIQDGEECHCSHHGTPDAMVPCCEILVTDVPESYAAEYRQFVEAYTRYWQTFFDPIAVRLQLQPSQMRAEMIVLPLINNSIYTGLSQILGGKPEQLDSLPIPHSNVATLAFKLDKTFLLGQLGIEPPQSDLAVTEEGIDPQVKSELIDSNIEQSLSQIGLGLHNHEATFRQLPPRTNRTLTPPAEQLSWRVQILPFLDEAELFQKFHMDEPWDSKHNLTLVSEIPEVFSRGFPKLAEQGKTRFVFPQNPAAIYTDPQGGGTFGQVTDGLSNTIMVMVADDAHAVPWTKPDDLKVDLNHPRDGLYLDTQKNTLALLGDGSVVSIPVDWSDEKFAHLITQAAGDTSDEDRQALAAQRRGRANNSWRRLLIPGDLVQELALDRFFYQGIGNQVAIHLGDAQPMVDFSASRMAGLIATLGGDQRFLNPGLLMFGVGAVALTSPFYISVPVNDGAIVDDTLEKLDSFLAKLVRREDIRGPVPFIEFDTYQIAEEEVATVRTFAFRFGPVTWRFYWLRLDNGLYISNLPTVVADLRAAVDRSRTTGPQVDQTAASHGLLRIRPEHWNQLLPHFRLGWAESERHVCLDNLPPLSHAARALLQDKGEEATLTTVRQLATDLFGGPLVCPTHGEYSIDPESGHASCSLHGTAVAPQQPMKGSSGKIASFAESLHDVRLELTFMEDGLHTVITIENKLQHAEASDSGAAFMRPK